MNPAAVSGEPWVATDPRNPQIVVATWTPILGSSSSSSPDQNYCPVGRSTDGGKTWTLVDAAQVWGPQRGPIGDPAVGVASDGAFYVVCSYAFSGGKYLMIKSTDGGATWSKPIEVANGSKPYSDRPDLIVDPVTGDVYVSATDNTKLGRAVTTSTDGGNTWSPFRPLSPNGECIWGDRIAAAGGVLAAGYEFKPGSADAGPSGVSCTTPCVVFETSSDHGETWSRHPLPAGTVGSSSTMGPRVHVAADSTHHGRYSVLIPFDSAHRLEVWVTDDSGLNWKQTKVLAAPAGDTQAKWSMAYSSTGALGVVWRTVHSDGSYDVSAIVSGDGGSTFGKVVPLTAKPTAKTGVGDDCACNLYLDKSTLSTAWADTRTGHEEAWFGRFDYTTFTPSSCNAD